MGRVLKEPSLLGKTEQLTDNFPTDCDGGVQVPEPQWMEGECFSEKMTDRILGSTSLHLHWAVEDESLCR